jgi:hypothetical protein
MDSELPIRPYKAADGLEMLKRYPSEHPDTGKWCKAAQIKNQSFSVIFEGKLVACAGIIPKMEGVGVAWALYPPEIGDYHIDPRTARDKLEELIEKHNYRRVEATVRADFPAGASYLRWMGFKREGRMKKYEPDGTDSFLYARTR